MKYCQNCGEELTDKAKFCPMCGASQEAPFCPTCGEPLQPKWKVCPECGRKLSAPSTEAVTAFENDAFFSHYPEEDQPKRKAPSAPKGQLLLSDIADKHQKDGVYRGISLPLGCDDNGIVTVDIDKKSPHVAILGGTGSGKSSLLKTLILGGAYHYSPGKLQFHLYDLKSNRYEPEYQDFTSLNHVKVMPTCDIQHLISDMTEECSRRRQLFMQKGVMDFDAYNHQMCLAWEDELPRILVIADDGYLAQNFADPASRHILSDFTSTTRQMRSSGIHFVWASQIIDGDFASSFSHRIELSGVQAGDLIERFYLKQEDRHTPLSPGQCRYYASEKDNYARRVQLAFPGSDTDIAEWIKKINAKWSNR